MISDPRKDHTSNFLMTTSVPHIVRDITKPQYYLVVTALAIHTLSLQIASHLVNDKISDNKFYYNYTGNCRNPIW